VLPYDAHLKQLARDLRKNSTLSEVLLWKQLRSGQRGGCDFHRQKPILHWIADFFCEELRLVIEIDGDSHRFRAEQDAEKEAALVRLGILTLRFGDSQVKDDMVSVLREIDRAIAMRRSDR